MSAQSTRIGRQLKSFRDKHGETVLFNGIGYKCFVEEVAGAKAGQQAVSHQTYDIFIASTAPSVFDFSPLDFLPNTAVIPPKEGDQLIRNALTYVITSVDYENEDADTGGFYCYALRKIWTTTAAPPAP